MLKDVNPLVSKLSQINEQMVAEKREEALGFMAARKNAVDQELQQIQAGQEFAETENQVTKPLEDIRNRVKNETSIPNISYLLEEFERAIYDAFDRIEEAKQPPDQEETINPKPAKKTKTIKTSSLSTKAYLENEHDVENFVQNLKQKLLAELGQDVRIRIE
jgi:hypothetical protein